MDAQRGAPLPEEGTNARRLTCWILLACDVRAAAVACTSSSSKLQPRPSPPYQATVIYTALVPGAFELTNLTGKAVYQNGTWKVGVRSFCGVLALGMSLYGAVR